MRRAHADAARGQPLVDVGRERAGDPEVGHEGVRTAQEDVLRLDVAVDHAVLVGIVKRVRDLARDAQRVVQRELLLAQQPGPQRFTVDVGHREPELPIGLA